MHHGGVRADYVAASHAAPLMVGRRAGLIVSLSSVAAQRYVHPVAYGVAHAAKDRLVADMAQELREFGVAAVSLYPGLVRTESVLANAQHFDLSQSESPELTGRAVLALATGPAMLRWSGRWLVVAELAWEYDFTDIDGRRPVSPRPPPQPS
jgi:dehydrogenase/reductase SDR family protein 1